MLWTILNVTHLWHFLLSLYEKSIHLILFGAEKMDFGMKFYIYGIVLSLYNTQRIMIKFIQCGCKNCIRICIIKYFAVWETHNGVITHLKPDILECEVRWALGSITTNKASGGDGIPVELFQILKDDAVKCCTQYASKFGKLSSGHRTRKGQFSFQSQRKAMPKNAQTTAQLHSSHTLVK